ncbi:MAG: membrane protein insertion efficiency factor YidD [Candidatus Zixiibacteriota bacterium]
MNKYPVSLNQLAEPMADCRVSRSTDGESRNADLRSAPRSVPLFAWPFLALIYIYRYSVGHWFSGSCRFYPSCSHYGEESFRKHGAWRGSIMTIKRLSRCHPWHDGGYDPVD